MTTIESMHGLHGKLTAMRDWDFPTDHDDFWRTMPNRVAECFGRKFMSVLSKRVHARHDTKIVYQVEIGRGRYGAGNVFAQIYVTETT
jgi:hypothetical protein